MAAGDQLPPLTLSFPASVIADPVAGSVPVSL